MEINANVTNMLCGELSIDFLLISWSVTVTGWMHEIRTGGGLPGFCGRAASMQELARLRALDSYTPALSFLLIRV